MCGDRALARLFQHALLLVFAVCFADDFARLQLEHLLLAQAETDQVARFSEDAQ